jgi:hypothetical protein
MNDALCLVPGNVSDVPGMMEAMAADIRDGKLGEVRHAAAVFIDDEGKLTVCGWGADGDDVRSAGLLALGAAWLSQFRWRRR